MGPVLGYRVWPVPQPSKYGGKLAHGTAGMPSKGSPEPSLCSIHKLKMKPREKEGWCHGEAERKPVRG